MSSPMREWMLPLGARYGESAAIADDFGDPFQEYKAACEAVAICDRSDRTRIQLRGRDRVRFLHNLCTHDIVGLAEGRGCEAFLTSVQGKILAYVRVFAEQDSLWLESVAGSGGVILKHFEKYLIAEQVELADVSDQYVELDVVGPQSRAAVEAVAGRPIRDLSTLGHEAVVLADSPCRVRFDESLQVPVYGLRIPAGQVADVWSRLWPAACERAGRPMGRRAFDVLRVEAGLPEYGVDIDATNLPQEVGRNQQAISFIKGCYLGQETVARIDALGHVNRHLVGLEFDEGSAAAASGAMVRSRDREVGKVTSSVHSWRLDRAIALGYVRRGSERPGTELWVESSTGAVRAVVASLPFRR